jgi:hypothetical protein
MKRILTVAACAMAAILLLSGDANARGRRAGGYATAYGGSGLITYGGVGPLYGNAPTYSYAPTVTYVPGYGYGAYGYRGYGGYGGYDFGRPGYNPGGLGGPRSGLGVRPGVGVGGLGVRR